MGKDFPDCNYRQISRIVKKLGFYLARTAKGSHEIWRRDIDGKQTTIPNHGNKSIKRKTIKSITDSIGLSLKELRDLL